VPSKSLPATLEAETNEDLRVTILNDPAGGFTRTAVFED
jgi:hypothetical protein